LELIRSGVDLNARNHDGRTALMYAAENRSLDITRALLLAGADTRPLDRHGSSAKNLVTTLPSSISLSTLSRSFAKTTNRVRLSNEHVASDAFMHTPEFFVLDLQNPRATSLDARHISLYWSV
jgi:ankyrin repeat protein